MGEEVKLSSLADKNLIDNYASWFKILDLLPDPYTYFNKENIYRIFRMMRKNDAHIKACLKQRISKTTKKKWDIVPASQSAQDKEIAQSVKDMITKLKPSDLFREILVAIPDGFQVSEILWDLQTDGSCEIKELKQKFPELFGFTSEGDLILKDAMNGPKIKGQSAQYINLSQKFPNKFVIHTNEEEFSDKHGSAVMASCFWSWTMKKAGLVFWQTMLDKFGSPTVAALMNGTGDAANKKIQRQAIADELIKLGNASAIALTDVEKLEVVNASGSGDDFQGFLQFLNNEISKAILTETLTVETQGTGSFALGEIHLETLIDITIEDAKSLQNIINSTIIKWYVQLNYGDVETPLLQFDLADKATLENVYKAIELGVPIRLDALEHDYHLPIAKDGDEAVIPPSQQNQQFSSKKKVLNPYLDSLM